MRMLNPAKIADKYVAGMQGASTAYKDGVNAVSVAPGQSAVLQKDKLIRNFMDSVNSGRWAANTAGVPLDQWKNLASTKGANNLAGGAIAAKSKVQAYWNVAAPEYQNGLAQLEAMPNSTPADADARMLFWANFMRQWKQRRGS